MAAIINGCITDMLLEDIIDDVYKTIWNVFVVEVFMCEQETSIYSRAVFNVTQIIISKRVSTTTLSTAIYLAFLT